MRYIKTSFAFIVSFSIISSIFIIYIAKFKSESMLGGLAREKLIRYESVINYANFNSPGDMKYIYSNSKNNSINVNLLYNNEFSPDKDAESWITDMVKVTTGKTAVINNFNNLKILKDSLSDGDLKDIRKEIKSNKSLKLNIIYLPRYLPKDSLAGIVLDRDTIYIFCKAIDALSEDNATLKRLEKSTLMHEWGHLLGVEHTPDENCVMSERVDVYDKHMLGSEQIPDEYCQETLNQIEGLRGF